MLRLAGIYGPDRIPRRDDLLAGVPIPGSGDGYLNLIHVDDAVRAIIAADQRAQLPRTFNVSDGHPAPRREYYQELAQLVDAPAPQFVPEAHTAERTRGGSDQRVQNARIVAELGVQWQYPSFREGLRAILNGK